MVIEVVLFMMKVLEDYFSGDKGGVVRYEGVGGLCCVKMLANRS